MHTLIDRLAANHMVVIDAPPVLAVTDGALLSAAADGTILVTRLGRTHRAALEQSTKLLDQTKARVLGVVLNAASKRSLTDSAYSYTGYTGYYKDYYAAAEPGRPRPSARGPQTSSLMPSRPAAGRPGSGGGGRTRWAEVALAPPAAHSGASVATASAKPQWLERASAYWSQVNALDFVLGALLVLNNYTIGPAPLGVALSGLIITVAAFRRPAVHVRWGGILYLLGLALFAYLILVSIDQGQTWAQRSFRFFLILTVAAVVAQQRIDPVSFFAGAAISPLLNAIAFYAGVAPNNYPRSSAVSTPTRTSPASTTPSSGCWGCSPSRAAGRSPGCCCRAVCCSSPAHARP
ncbi:hypothetical protein [Barrientosiimonas endolithica]|uniref:CpsD/CapB family tyrosine-protein kinase n=1 Tax=Barrientosiimonas endolithica TaxID=1535208 RepID=A0ABM8HDJ7_9MICO|nr:hypothetical protein [Barrientosiimonas endolithica]BDZ59061.1 hypothetical protein GCM10025872_27180 [Barrientosiimonas endolithica]